MVLLGEVTRPPPNQLPVDTLTEYLTRLSSTSSTPGGGSAATVVAAFGASLVAMVARINLGNPKRAAQHALARDLIARADGLRRSLEIARVADEAAFEAVVEAQALPNALPDEAARRTTALEAALTHAAAEPLHAAKLALEVLLLAHRSLDIPNRNLASDLGCAADFASAALNACAYNVRINHRFMHDAQTVTRQANEIERYERRSRALAQAVRTAVNELLAS